MNKHLMRTYEYYDARDAQDWQLLPKADLATQAIKFATYQSFLDSHKPFLGEIVEPTEQDMEIAEQAKLFVEKTLGIEVDCGLVMVESLMNRDSSGTYNPFFHFASIKKKETKSGFGNAISLGGTLVHELVHSTMAHTAKVIDIDDGVVHDIRTLHSHHLTDINRKFSTEYFFEEGLAEEIASRWREQCDLSLVNRGRDLLRFTNTPMPARMYEADLPIDEVHESKDYQVKYSSTALCAYGIQIISEYSGVDVVDLLIKARKPETQAHANELLKATVDSIEPGLYDVLTSARYTWEDFNDCLAIIKDAIANHAHSQIK